MSDVLRDPRANAVLARLRAQETAQSDAMNRYYREKRLEEIRVTDPNSARDMEFVRDKLVALDPGKCELCFLLCRALNAKRVVEFGTSFGVSTIYLASAVRDVASIDGRSGTVIGTEIEPAKAAAAGRNLAEAGLEGFVDLRVGDARQSLKDCGGPVDFVLLDSWVPLVRPIIEILAPQLRQGAIVLCDNVQMFEDEYKDYTAFIRSPRNGFSSVLLAHEGGLEVSVKLA